MREPTRIAGMFGVIGLSTFFILVLVSLAAAQVRVIEQPGNGPTEVIILSPSASDGDAAAAAEAAMRTAVANRLARIIYAVLKHGEAYRRSPPELARTT